MVQKDGGETEDVRIEEKKEKKRGPASCHLIRDEG